ncbi:hypothetical protein ABZ454_37425 [Streptomyces sp. NPDC005803]|uniref:hypothetical protein n=1 Tax=Streptomyces sp. NPDC005803 TaxID=3154297 RepID=UPI0033CDE846
MLLIEAFYDVTGSQPDGDTVHFTADNPTEWDLVGSGDGRAVEQSAVGRATLRRDAVKTHYGRVVSSRVRRPLPVRSPSTG